MSGACTTLSVSSTALISGSLSVNGIINSGALTQSGLSSFQGSTFNSTALFSLPPTMSGASIASGTIQSGSVSGDVMTLNNSTNQTKTAGALTFGSGANLTTTNAIAGSVTNVQIGDTGSSSNNCYFGLINQPGGYSLSTVPSKQTVQSDGQFWYIPSSKTLYLSNAQISGTLLSQGATTYSSGSSLTVASGSSVSLSATETVNSGGGITFANLSNLTIQSGCVYNMSTTQNVMSGALIDILSGAALTAESGSTVNLKGTTNFTTFPIISISSAPSLSTQVGYYQSFSLGIASTGSSIQQISGGAFPLSGTAFFGTYLIVCNVSVNNISTSGYVQSSINNVSATQSSGNGVVVNNSMATATGGAVKASFSYVFQYYTVSAPFLYINNNTSGTMSGTNSSTFSITRIA